MTIQICVPYLSFPPYRTLAGQNDLNVQGNLRNVAFADMVNLITGLTADSRRDGFFHRRLSVSICG
jgi:hypothetical protein